METKDCLRRKVGLTNFRACLKLFYSKKDPDLFRPSGIVVFSGAQGSGKTLGLINTLQDILRRYPKAKVYSNIKLNGISYLPFTGVENFSDEESNGTLGTIYVIDENGVIEKVMLKVKPDTNAAEILAYLAGEE